MPRAGLALCMHRTPSTASTTVPGWREGPALARGTDIAKKEVVSSHSCHWRCGGATGRRNHIDHLNYHFA